MKTRIYIIIICLVATVNANAQVATSRYASYDQVDVVVNQPGVTATPRYSSPIYEPFSNTTPSERSEGLVKHRPRRAGEADNDPWGHNEDAGEKDPNSPIGDALLPLLALALAFSAVTYFRRKRLAK